MDNKSHSHCKVCGSSEVKEYGINRKFYLLNLDETIEMSYLCCENCKFIFNKENYSDQFLENYYQTSFMLRREEILETESRVFKEQSDFIQNYFEIYGKEVLEIGADTGQFLVHIKDYYNCKTYYDELNIDALKILEKRGNLVNIHDSKEDFKEKFDLVIVRHVLEHVQEMDGFLEYIKGMLKDEGIIYFEVPDYSFLDEKTDNFIFEHVSYYNATNLSILMQNNNLIVEKLELNINPLSPATQNRVIRALVSKPSNNDSFKNKIIAFNNNKLTTQEKFDSMLNSFTKDTTLAITPTSHLSISLVLNNSNSNHKIEYFDIDSRKVGREIDGIKVSHRDNLCSNDFDKILIMVEGAVENEIKKSLVQNGADESKIITYSQMIEERY